MHRSTRFRSWMKSKTKKRQFDSRRIHLKLTWSSVKLIQPADSTKQAIQFAFAPNKTTVEIYSRAKSHMTLITATHQKFRRFISSEEPSKTIKIFRKALTHEETTFAGIQPASNQILVNKALRRAKRKRAKFANNCKSFSHLTRFTNVPRSTESHQPIEPSSN